MATKKKTTTKTTVEEPEKELDAFDRARLDFLGESGVKLTIYRYDDGEAAYLKRVQWSESIDEEWIRKKWGPGTYQLRFVDEGGERRYSQVVQIAADVPPATPPAATSASSSESLFIETIRRQNELMLQAMLARSTSPSPGAGGNEALVALVQGMQAQNLELLKSTINRPDISSTLLQVLERGMAIASESRADSEGGWLAQVARIAKEVLPSVAEMARARAMTPPPGTIGVAGAGVSGNPPMSTSQPALPPGAPPANGAPAPSGFDLDELVRGYASVILDAARAGTKPEDVADAILGFIPSALWDELEPLTAERAIRVAPALSQHRGFVELLVGSLKDAIREDDDRGPETA
jgi:hypothetical protein